MSKITSEIINMSQKDKMTKKKYCPDLGFAQWPIGPNVQNDSKFQIGIRTNLNMIDLESKKVCCFTKVRVKDFFAQIKPGMWICGVLWIPNFMENMNLTKKWKFLISLDLVVPVHYINSITWWPKYFRNIMLYFIKHVMVQDGIVIPEKQAKSSKKIFRSSHFTPFWSWRGYLKTYLALSKFYLGCSWPSQILVC